jgi:hypothetical protein
MNDLYSQKFGVRVQTKITIANCVDFVLPLTPISTPLSPPIKFAQLRLQSYRQQVLSVDAAYLHFTFSRAVSNLTILGVLLVSDIARQVKYSQYLPWEIACRGV